MSYSTSLSLDLSDRLLAAKRDIHYIRIRLADTGDTLRAHQRMQAFDCEKVLFIAHQLFGTAADWWETYSNTHLNANAISWNEFKAIFRTHYVPRGTHKLKKKEFSYLNQGSVTVNEYLN
jgi:hypothetical protein